MSIQAICWVLEHSQSEHSARLVLLVLANHAGGDHGDSYPSVPRIAREARLGASTVRLAIADLLEAGEIVEVGLSPLRTRTFRLTYTTAVEAPDTPQNLDPPDDAEAPATPQILDPSDSEGPLRMRASDTADSEAEPYLNRKRSLCSPQVARDAEQRIEDDVVAGGIVDVVAGILQRGLEGLTTDEPCRPVNRAAILAAIQRLDVDAQTARIAAIAAREIAQAHNRAPNITALYVQRLEAIASAEMPSDTALSQPTLTG